MAGRAIGNRLLLLAIFLAPGAALSACGIRTPLDLYYPPENSGVHVAIDASPGLEGFDAGSTHDADDGSAESTAPDVALPLVDLGDILLTSGSYSEGQTLTATASFFPSVGSTGCAVEEVAPGCTLETCGSTSGAALVSAGTMLVSGGIYPLTLQQSLSSYYTVPAGMFDDGGIVALWSGGESLVVNASGGVVPSFVAQLTAPTQVTVLTPLPSAVALRTPFDFSWTGASAGKIAFDLGVTIGSGDAYLDCQFDVGAGAGSVPVAALEALQDGGTSAAMTISTVVEVQGNAGPWSLKAFAQTNANDDEGREYSVTVTLQ